PTEATTYTTYAEIEKGSSEEPAIGRPITNTQVYVLDEGMEVNPIGVPGEVYIDGAIVTRGYGNRGEATAERYVPNPIIGEGARLYRTGDIGKYRRDGEIEYIGRRDNQVKIRGYRIELGEIEAALRRQPGVKECAVIAQEDQRGHKTIV